MPRPSLACGKRTLVQRRRGAEDHEAMLLRLNDGTTFDEFMDAAPDAQVEADLEELITLAGGPGAPAGTDGGVILDLRPGSYVLLCRFPDARGTPHADLGMVAVVEVAAAEPPAPDATVRLLDFSFAAPDTLPAGTTTLDVVNDGPQIHELALLKLDEGVPFEEALATEAFTQAGWVAPMSSGERAYTTVELTPGDYVLACGVSDPETGTLHFELGMLRPFTVE